ncbi:MAG: type IX secretion system membrane protein PorP/SprF [Bacteroidales bacterium]|nr:type IX secretion system membrane protein PorP/SprF [Bacteroidales bacterium]MBK9356140.1 type IX secretion system membrane protein PorP/SprF [Bacteroidales bacterium]
MKKLTGLFLLFFSISAFAQQDPLFSQYMFNKLLLNPAYTGSREVLTVDLLDRYQWVGIDGAPRTFTVGAHMATRNKKVGIGVYAYRDAIGPMVNQGLMASYAYRLLMPGGSLSFGLQAGFKYFDFDWTQMNVEDPDYVFNPQDVQRFTPDANFGIYYQSRRYFAGLSSKQLFQNEYGKSYSGDKTTYTKLLRHFYAMGGAAFPIDDKIVFRPSMLVKFVKNAPIQLDVNASILFDNIFWVGASYRTEQAVVLLTEFRISKTVRVGYSYDIYFGPLLPYNKGSHEIRLGFDLDFMNERTLTPRFFF